MNDHDHEEEHPFLPSTPMQFCFCLMQGCSSESPAFGCPMQFCFCLMQGCSSESSAFGCIAWEQPGIRMYSLGASIAVAVATSFSRSVNGLAVTHAFPGMDAF
jgi:hypothetical protein